MFLANRLAWKGSLIRRGGKPARADVSRFPKIDLGFGIFDWLPRYQKRFIYEMF
jgi:hypothetical protein